MNDRNEILKELTEVFNRSIKKDVLGKKGDFIQTASSWLTRGDKDICLSQVSLYKNYDSLDNPLSIHFLQDSLIINHVEIKYEGLLQIISFMYEMKKLKEKNEQDNNDKE